MSARADRLAELKGLQCHFTWDINRENIEDLRGIRDKLPDRIKFCPDRYHASYYNVLAYVSYLEGENGAALDFLSKAERILGGGKDDVELLVTYGNYAWLHYHSGNTEEVDTYLRKLDDITKGHPEASKTPCSLPLIHGEKGWTFLRLGASFYQRAKESFEKALEGEPDNISFNAGYAVVLYRLDGMTKGRNGATGESSKVTGQLKRALELEPDNAEAMVLLALKLQSEGREKQHSRDLIEKALQIAPEVPHVTRYIAKYFRMEGCVEESLQVLGKALELAPTSSFLNHQIGLCHKLLLIKLQERRAPRPQIKAKAQECIRHFSKAVELKPSNSYARANLAESYADSGQEGAAERAFSEMVKDSSMKDSDLQHCLVSYGLFLMYKRKNESGAVTQLQAAYRIGVQGSDREKAGKKLRQLAERSGNKGRGGEEKRILQFLKEEDEKLSSNDEISSLRARLLKLECRFTWALKRDDFDIENLSIRLQDHIDQGYLQGKPEEAMSLLCKSVELTREHFGEDSDRHLIVSYADMAWLHYHIGDYTQSHTSCQKLEETKEKYPTGAPTMLQPEVYGEKGWTFMKFSHQYLQKAVDCFLKALEQQPDHKEWNVGYAIALYRTDEELSSAEESLTIQQLRRAIDMDPEDGMLMVLLALKLVVYNKRKEAEDLVETALRIDPDDPLVTSYVVKYLRKQGQVDKSIGLLKRVLLRSSQSAFIHHQLALCYKSKKNDQYSRGPYHAKASEIQRLRRQCIHHLEEAVKINPFFIYTTAELALMYGEEKDLPRAEEMFQKALEVSKKDDDLQFFHMYYGMFHHYHTKKEALAVIHYTKKLKTIAGKQISADAKDAEGYGLLGLVCRAKGDKREAAEWYEKALERDLHNDEYLSALCDLRMDLQ